MKKDVGKSLPRVLVGFFIIQVRYGWSKPGTFVITPKIAGTPSPVEIIGFNPSHIQKFGISAAMARRFEAITKWDDSTWDRPSKA